MYHNYSLEVSALKISFSALFWKKKISCFPRFCTEYILTQVLIVLKIQQNYETSFLSLIAESLKYVLSSIPI